MIDATVIHKIAIWVLPVLFAITVHEVAHGYAAYKLGDPTAKWLGRLTLNPVKHIDPIGTILVPGFLLLTSPFVFGWAKPVPVSYGNLHHPRRDMAIVAFAGPFSNFIMAILWAAFAKCWLLFFTPNTPAIYSLVQMGFAGIQINLILMLLNLIPIPPLDGSRILSSVLSPAMGIYFATLEVYGFFVLLLLLATGVINQLLMPPFYFMIKLFQTLFGL